MISTIKITKITKTRYSLGEFGIDSLRRFPTLGLKTKRDIRVLKVVDKEHEIERR